MADVDVRTLVLADLVTLGTTRADCLADRDVVLAEIEREKATAKGARTYRLRHLEAAVIYLTRAGVATSLETGLRLAREAIEAAAQAPPVTEEVEDRG